jgi:hypothetical protein
MEPLTEMFDILCLALLYNGINSSVDAMRGKHDTLGSMGAGALTGALFKSTGKIYVWEARLILTLFDR